MKKAIEGEPWPKERLGVVKGLRKALFGPNSPDGVVIDWRRIPYVPKIAAQGWPKVEGDPTAKPLWPLGWCYGAALGIKAAFVDETRRAEPSAQPGAACLSFTGNVAAGLLPEGQDFGKVNDDELGGDFYTLVARMRPVTWHVAPVFIVPETSRLIVPPTVIFLEEIMPIGNAALLELVGNPAVV